jgi:hypothetical protein
MLPDATMKRMLRRGAGLASIEQAVATAPTDKLLLDSMPLRTLSIESS